MTAREWLDAVEARANAATDGPWALHSTANAEPVVVRAGEGMGRGYPWGVVARMSNAQEDYGYADAEFIAHARADVPALVAALRAVLDLMDECDATVLRESPHPGRRIVGVDPTTAQVRAVIDANLGGAA